MTLTNMICHNCGATITRQQDRGYFFRGHYRPLCVELQACAERGVALRQPVAVPA